MKISAALIVRDEEASLGHCLESLREHVDEIVVVDTGSADGTKDLARQFGAQVFDFGWRDDFAAARQCSFDLARGDWVFWVDADDVVLNAGCIRPELSSAPPGIGCYYWKYLVGADECGEPQCELWRERCVRNNRNFRWRGRVHEVLVPQRRVATRRSRDVGVAHRPDARCRPRNPRRNLEILESEYASSRGRVTPRVLYYLGQEYADTGQYGRAIEYLEQYVEVSRWDEEKYFALLRLAELERLCYRFAAACRAGEAALRLRPEWPNAYFSLAETYYFLKDWQQVARYAEEGSRLPRPDTVCPTSPRALRHSWIIYYTNALFHLGRLREAREWTSKALQIRPGEPWHVNNQQFFSAWEEVPPGGAEVPEALAETVK
jgi:glycosyltransferase involved in cell wall biosynthesis